MLKNLKKVAVGEFYGTEMTGITREDNESTRERVARNISEGIGSVIHVMPPNSEVFIKAVLEDFDYETDADNKRYIFSYYDETNEKDVRIDTLFDAGWVVKI